MFYIWVPILIALHIWSTRLSVLNNSGDNAAALWMWAICALPMWMIISRYSKNILFDAMLYDVLLVIVYTCGIAYFGDKALSILNFIGIALMFIGLMMVKL
jgi:hypothetical protein